MSIKKLQLFDDRPRLFDVGLETNYFESWQNQFNPPKNDFNFEIPAVVSTPVFQTITPPTAPTAPTSAK